MAVRRSGLTLPSALKLNEIRQSLGRIVELLRVWNGEGRDSRDRVLTMRDLEQVGGVVRGGVLVGIGGGDDAPEVTPIMPLAPTGVVASAAFHNVVIAWDPPGYTGHAYAEIWRAGSDDLGAAALIGMAPGRVFGDSDVVGSTTYYYWVRFVSVTDLAGPFNDTAGTAATTAPDIEYLLEQLTDQITESELAQALESRIDLIDASELVAGSVAARIAQEAADRAAAVAQEAQDRAAAVAQEASDRAAAVTQEAQTRQQQVDILTGDLSDEVQARMDEDDALGADIQSEATLRNNEDDKLAKQLTLLFVQGGTDATVTRSATAPANPAIGDYWIDTSLADLVLRQWDGAAWVPVDGLDAVSLKASVATETQARIDGDEANAQEITQLKATVNDPLEGVEANAEAVSILKSTVNDPEKGVLANAEAISFLEAAAGVASATVEIAADIDWQTGTLSGVEANGGLKLLHNGTAYPAFGTREASADFAAAGGYRDSTITWTATEPAGTSVSVAISHDNGVTWLACTKDAELPGFTLGETVGAVLLRQTLSTTDPAATPVLASLTARVNPSVSDVISAHATAIDALETTVNNSETGVSANAQQIVALKGRLDDPATGLIASADAIQDLETTVNDDATGVSANAQQIAILKGRLDDPDTGLVASADAIQDLETTVNDDFTGVSANAQQITILKGRLDDPNTGLIASADAIQDLETTVNDGTTGVSANAQAILGLKGDIEDPATGLQANAQAIGDLSLRVQQTEDDIDVHGQSITTLTGSVQNAQDTANSKNRTFFQASAPTAEAVGDEWIDSDDSNKRYRWNGTAWQPVDDSRISANAQAIQTLEITVNDSDEGVVANAQAIQTLEGTVNDPLTGVTATAGAVELLQGTVQQHDDDIGAHSQSIITLTGDVQNAQNTANSKNRTFRQATAPTAEAVGDEWIDSDDDNKRYRWNGTIWQAVYDSRVDSHVQAIQALETTVNDNDQGVLANAQAILDLRGDIEDPATGLQASALAIDDLELTVNNSETGVAASAQKIGVLEGRVDNPETGLVASANAIEQLEITVNDSETGVVASADKITQLQSTVNGLADTNLVFNGDASEGSNAGWSLLTYTATGYQGAGFSTTTVGTVYADAANLAAVETERRYALSMVLRCASANTTIYAGFACFKADKTQVMPWECWRDPAKDTTLAAAVSPNDTVIQVNPASEAFFTPTSSHLQFEPDQENGNLPAESPQIASIDTSGSPWLVTLSDPVGGSYPAGTAVGNAHRGASWNYALLNGAAPGTAYQEHSAVIGGGTNAYDEFPPHNLFRIGTAYVSPLILANWTNPSTTYVDEMRLIPFSEVNQVTFEEMASVTDGLSAQYTVKIDNNGAVAGFGLASTASNDTSDPAFSEFYINAERVAILPQSGTPGVDDVSPFIVDNGTVYMDIAMIKNAAITNAKIASLAADKIFAASGTIADALIGTADIGSAMIANAAITNAKIANAAVGTLKIAGQAVTFPSSAYTAAQTATTQGAWTTVQTLVVTSTGESAQINASGYFFIEQTNGDLFSMSGILRVRRDSTTIWTAPLTHAQLWESSGSDFIYHMWERLGLTISDTPSAGTRTYTLQFFASATGETAFSSTAQHRYLGYLELKR